MIKSVFVCFLSVLLVSFTVFIIIIIINIIIINNHNKLFNYHDDKIYF